MPRETCVTPGELRARVLRETGAGVLLLALMAAWPAGAPGFIGVAGAGAISLANFWWLARGASATLRASSLPGAASGAWMLAAGLRFLGLVAAFATLCATGWAHPVAVVVGLTVLPCNLIALGLRAARD
jgi:hypothetical protein